MEPELVTLLSSKLGTRIDSDFVHDLLESADATSASALWQWVSDTERSFELKGSAPAIELSPGFRRAKDQGYFVATKVRAKAGLAPDEPIPTLSSIADRLGKTTIFENRNHLPSRRVHAVVGGRGDGAEVVIAGPASERPEQQRFLESRCLYQALVGCGNGARLITRAHTWDQQASRAFAAELLAPRKVLAGDAGDDLEPDEWRDLEEKLAARFRVSTEVIRRQLQNEGVRRQGGDF